MSKIINLTMLIDVILNWSHETRTRDVVWHRKYQTLPQLQFDIDGARSTLKQCPLGTAQLDIEKRQVGGWAQARKKC